MIAQCWLRWACSPLSRQEVIQSVCAMRKGGTSGVLRPDAALVVSSLTGYLEDDPGSEGLPHSNVLLIFDVDLHTLQINLHRLIGWPVSYSGGRAIEQPPLPSGRGFSVSPDIAGG